MSCERCAARPAKLKYTELREGKSRTLWICEECARELGFGTSGPPGDAPPGPGTAGGPEPPGLSAPGPDAPGPGSEGGEEAPAPGTPDAPEGEGPSEGSPPPLAGLVLGMLGVTVEGGGAAGTAKGSEIRYARLRCPGCGITGAELRDRTLLGCPRCYETFVRPLDDLLLRLHGALDHAGRLPRGKRAVAPDPQELHRQLQEAIANEDFEAAARLRDRLRRIRRNRE